VRGRGVDEAPYGGEGFLTRTGSLTNTLVFLWLKEEGEKKVGGNEEGTSKNIAKVRWTMPPWGKMVFTQPRDSGWGGGGGGSVVEDVPEKCQGGRSRKGGWKTVGPWKVICGPMLEKEFNNVEGGEKGGSVGENKREADKVAPH